MSLFLNDLVCNKISLEEGLQRLLIIANKTNNIELSNWCNYELNGYKDLNSLPEYRKVKSRNINYTGLNGSFSVKDVPIGPGFLKEETLKKIENIGVFENIIEVERIKKSNTLMKRDLTQLAYEVYENTNTNHLFGVQCLSLYQIFPVSIYSNIF